MENPNNLNETINNKIELEKREALSFVDLRIKEELEKLGTPLFVEDRGQNRKIESKDDEEIANTQQLTKATKIVLESVSGNDYRKEQVTREILDNLIAHEDYLKRRAGLSVEGKNILDGLFNKISKGNPSNDDQYLVGKIA